MTRLPDFRRALPLCLVGAAIVAGAAPAAAQTRSIEGRIRTFECGDNCYLTIVAGANEEHTGLCTAPECTKWNEAAAMPRRFMGKRVLVTVGRGVQRDAEGNVMGRMMAFDKLRFLD